MRVDRSTLENYTPVYLGDQRCKGVWIVQRISLHYRITIILLDTGRAASIIFEQFR